MSLLVWVVVMEYKNKDYDVIGVLDSYESAMKFVNNHEYAHKFTYTIYRQEVSIMRTAKEMLLIAKKAHYYINYMPDKEREIMSLIVAEAGKGKTSIYTGLSICDELKARLEQYGYTVSEPMYANEEEGVYESCVSWGDKL